jgi:two-component system OmpR family sensor kinase
MIPVRSLRFRMMLLFCVAVGVLLAGSHLVFYTILAREIRAQLDRQLLEASSPVVADLASDADEADIAELNIPDEYFELLDSSGRVVAYSQNVRQRPLSLTANRMDVSQTVFESADDQERGRLRLVFIPLKSRTGKRVLALAMPTRESDRALLMFRHMIFALLPVGLVIMGMVSSWYVGRALQPIAELTRHATEMAKRIASHESREAWQPLVVSNSQDELGRLAGTFNQLFTSVDSAIQQLRQFVTDASHELRTPLSVLRGEAELTLLEARSPEEYQEALRVMHGELIKLSRIVEGLFTLAMADAGQLRLAREPLYLNEVLEESCALATPLAQAKGIAVDQDLKEGIFYLGDEAFLRQLFLIFLENAIKYSPPKTRVRVRLNTSDGLVRAQFQDEGFGISDDHLPHIFERFYRAAPPVAGETHSGGLGLAIAQAIVRAEGGSVDCQTALGIGSTFTITLPAQAQQSVPPPQDK